MNDQKVTVEDVFSAAQYVWGFSKEQICDTNRVGPKSFARHAIRWYLVKIMGFVTQEAASITGRANHATILNSIKIVDDSVETKLKPFSDNFRTFVNVLESIECSDDEMGGTLQSDRVLKIQRNGNMVLLKDNKITVVNSRGMKKYLFDPQKPISEFISVVLSITK